MCGFTCVPITWYSLLEMILVLGFELLPFRSALTLRSEFYYGKHMVAACRWPLTILAANAVVFSSSLWGALEPVWVFQLPLIFPTKCGKHQPPHLLSSFWAHRREKWLNLQAAQWWNDKIKIKDAIWFCFFIPFSVLCKKEILTERGVEVCMTFKKISLKDAINETKNNNF